MFLESYIYECIRPSTETLEGVNYKKINIIRYVLYFFTFIIAILVAWDCNKQVTGLMKFINIIIAGMFSSIYLVFYMVYRLWLGNKCY